MQQVGYPDKYIYDFTWAQLQTINFASYLHTAKAEYPITLAEFISRYKDQCSLQIEIKHHDLENPLSAHIKVQRCLDCIGDTQNSNIVISSFSLECLQYAQQLGTQIPLIYTFKNKHHLIDVKNCLNRHRFIAGVCYPIDTLNTALIQFLRNTHKIVAAYTCNTHQQIQKALDLKVDILLTDDIAMALKIRDATVKLSR